MPRKPRYNLKGFYHVINRGVEKRVIFMDETDFEMFKKILQKSASEYSFKLYAYALMPNHYHLLIETSTNNLSLIFRQVNSKYSIYFNKKYNRVGPLWQGRFKSFYVYDSKYLDIVIKYIEYNPIKAGIVDTVKSYPYASKNTADFNDIQWLESDKEKWSRWVTSKFVVNEHKNAVDIKRLPLPGYFVKKKVSDFEMVRAWLDGYKQTAIAEYLNLSTAMVSRRIGRYYKKKELFLSIKKNGLLWSYDNNLEYSEALDRLLIENTLKYGDIKDLKQLFILYGKREVKKIWNEKLIKDIRFIKVNYFLARNLFNMDIEADFFKGGKSDREQKLRMLAT